MLFATPMPNKFFAHNILPQTLLQISLWAYLPEIVPKITALYSMIVVYFELAYIEFSYAAKNFHTQQITQHSNY